MRRAVTAKSLRGEGRVSFAVARIRGREGELVGAGGESVSCLKVATRLRGEGFGEGCEVAATYLVLRLHRSLSIPTVERTTRRSAFVRIG